MTSGRIGQRGRPRRNRAFIEEKEQRHEISYVYRNPWGGGGACLTATAALAAPPAEYAGSETFSDDRVVEIQLASEQVVLPQGCNDAFYDSGDAFVFNTGRTVGTSTAWEVYQPFTLTEAYELCAIATDGWYVTGSPDTFRGSIFPDNAGTPDINNELAGADFRLLGSGSPHFVTQPVTPVTLQPNTLYYFGARATGDHWSAIYRDTENGSGLMQSFSIRLGNFGERFAAPPITLRLFGVPGGGGFTARLSGPCPGQKTLSWDGAGSGQMGIVIGNSQGNFTIPFGPCQGTQLGITGGLTLFNIIGTQGGSGQVTSTVGTQACGKFVQLIKTNDCSTSNVAGPI